MAQQQQQLCHWWFSMGAFSEHLREDFARLRFSPSKVRAHRAWAESLVRMADFNANSRHSQFTFEEATRASNFLSFMAHIHFELHKAQFSLDDFSKEQFVQLMLCGKFTY
jgi:hypothetical protein